ncbi:DUF1697 domain-containing protein [Candidatus Woesearchaeota archaeon]|nr:DUF1697 domain-containing protein [Candidatus Woesearchaeota archaeon]
MHTYISLLRGVNVAGQKKIKMSDLRALYESLGFRNVTTYIQSGNVIFQSTQTDLMALSQKIEEKIHKKYHFQVAVIIRTIPEMKQIIDENPFVKDRHEEVNKLYSTFLTKKPSPLALQGLNQVQKNKEEFVISSRTLYLFIPESYGKAVLSNTLLEKRLKVTASTRNWKTVLKLVELAETSAGERI